MKNWLWIVAAGTFTIPALYLRLSELPLDAWVNAVVFGIAIVSAAFLLAWAAETAQLEVSQALVLAVLAIVAVLPEYAVDMYFAWTAAKQPEYASYAAANMTGANRLLVGIGWPLVVLISWLKRRDKVVKLDKPQTTEITFLVLATLYSFIIPIKGNISLWDTLVFVTLFGFYIWASSKSEQVEPELAGPSATLAALPSRARRAAIVGLFLFPGAVILASAEPFAQGLLGTAEGLGMDEFIMVQWIAPLASEAPELIIATIFVLNGGAAAALGMLVSAKVNQWTLLIGMIPLVFSISLGAPGALPLDARQVEEILLTSAQSSLALIFLSRLRLSLLAAGVLFLLFASQLGMTSTLVRYGYSALYLAVTLGVLLKDRGRAACLFRMTRDTVGGMWRGRG